MKIALCDSASPQVSARAHNSATDSPANVKLAGNEGGLNSPRTSRPLTTSPPLLQICEEDEDSRGLSVEQQAKQLNQQPHPHSQPLHSPSANSVGLREPQPQERRGPSRSAHSPASLDNRPAVDERLIDLTQAAPAVHTPLSRISKQSANSPQLRPASTDARAPVPNTGPPTGRPQSVTTTASRRPPGPGPRTHYVGSPDHPDDRTARLLRSPAQSHTSTLPEEVSPTQSRSERIAAGYGDQEFNRPRLTDSPTTGRQRRRDGVAVGPEFNSRSSSSEDLDAHRSATDSEFDPVPVLAASDPFGPLVPAVRDARERFVPLGARPPAPVFVSPQSPPIRATVVEGYIDLSGAVPIPIPIQMPHRFAPPTDDRQPRRLLPPLQPGLPMQRPPPPMLQQQLDWAETHSLRGASGGRALPPQPPYPQARPPFQPQPMRAAVSGVAVREFAAGAPLPPQDRRGARPPSGAYDGPAPEQQSELSSSEGDWF